MARSAPRGAPGQAFSGFEQLDDEIREEDLNAASYSEPASSGFEDDGQIFRGGMHHNNARLQEMLSMARACLRSGRLPGDTKPEDLYARWDREAEVEDQRKAEHFEELNRRAEELIGIETMCDAAPGGERKVTPLRLVETPETLSVREHIAKLRRDLHRIERSAHERRHELDAVNVEASREVLERCAAEAEVERLKEETGRTKKNLRELRDMRKRQQREIREMDEQIELAKQQALKVPPASARAGRRGTSRGAEKTLEPSQLAGGGPSAPSRARRSPRKPRGAAAELAEGALQPSPRGLAITEIPGIPKEWLLPRPPPPPPPVHGGLLQNLRPPSDKAILSVLTTRPRHHKVYI